MENIYSSEHYRNLPHIYVAGAKFFITFRLYNSIPTDVLIKFQEEKALKISEIEGRKLIDKEKQKVLYQEEKRFFVLFDNILERHATDDSALKNPEIAQIVADKMYELDEHYYDLLAFCIMSNHVHLLIDTKNYEIFQEKKSVSYFMQLLKGGTAFQINRKLGRKGTFWQAESYDHIVRNEKALLNITRYIALNPVKAGLVENWENWHFTYIHKSLIQAFE